MDTWINLGALWRVVVIGLLAGAGLPALFAVGLRAWYGRTVTSGSVTSGTVTSGTVAGGEDVRRAPNVAAGVVAVGCFAVVLGAVVWGIWSIVSHR